MNLRNKNQIHKKSISRMILLNNTTMKAHHTTSVTLCKTVCHHGNRIVYWIQSISIIYTQKSLHSAVTGEIIGA